MPTASGFCAWIILLLLAGWPNQVAADGCGQALGKPQIEIRSDIAPARLDLTRSLAALTRDPDLAGSRTPAFPYAVGATGLALELKWSLHFAGTPRSDGGFCWSVQSLDITVNATATIFIASEIPRDSCLWRAVERHEQRHVMVDRQLFPELARMLRPPVLDAARRTAAAASGDEAKTILGAAIEDAIEAAQRAYESRRMAHHLPIDTPEEYNSFRRICGDAEVQAVLSRAGMA